MANLPQFSLWNTCSQLFVHHDLSCAIKAHWIWDPCSDRTATVGKGFRSMWTEWCLLEGRLSSEGAALSHSMLKNASSSFSRYTSLFPHWFHTFCSNITSLSALNTCSFPQFWHFIFSYLNFSSPSPLAFQLKPVPTTRESYSETGAGSMSELLLVYQCVFTHPAPQESSNFWVPALGSSWVRPGDSPLPTHSIHSEIIDHFWAFKTEVPTLQHWTHVTREQGWGLSRERCSEHRDKVVTLESANVRGFAVLAHKSFCEDTEVCELVQSHGEAHGAVSQELWGMFLSSQVIHCEPEPIATEENSK